MISILRLALLLVFKFTPSLTLWLVHFSLDLFPWRWQHHDNPGLTDVKNFLVETLAGLKVCKGPAKKKKKKKNEWALNVGFFSIRRDPGDSRRFPNWFLYTRRKSCLGGANANQLWADRSLIIELGSAPLIRYHWQEQAGKHILQNTTEIR